MHFIRSGDINSFKSINFLARVYIYAIISETIIATDNLIADLKSLVKCSYP